jgi:hypothetical protein
LAGVLEGESTSDDQSGRVYRVLVGGQCVPIGFWYISNVGEPVLQVNNGAIRKFDGDDAALAGQGFEKTLDPFLELDMQRPGGRRDNNLAILEFVSLGTLRTFWQS